MFNTFKRMKITVCNNEVFCLVDSVEGGVAGVQLDGGQDSVTAGGGSDSGGSGVGSDGGSDSGGSSIGGGGKGSGDGGGSGIGGSGKGGSSVSTGKRGSSVSTGKRGSSVSTSKRGSSVSTGKRGSSVSTIGSIGVGSGGSDDLGISRPLGNSGLGGLISLEESGLGLSNLGGVNNGDSVVDGGNRGNSGMDGGHGEVITLDTETKSISDVVNSVDTSLISIGVRSGHTTEGVARLLLGRVDVLVSVGDIAELILSLELGAGD